MLKSESEKNPTCREAANIFKTMQISIKDNLKRIAPYVDRPNSLKDKIGEPLGKIILVLFVGAFLYLVITGIPTIIMSFGMFIKVITSPFN